MKRTSAILSLVLSLLLLCVASCVEEIPLPDYDEGVHYFEGGVDCGSVVTLDGVTWAPVNCGTDASSYPWGKLFQWARCDGQGYSTQYDASVPQTSGTPWTGNLGEADPFTVYYGFTAATPIVSLDRYYWAVGITSSSWNEGSRTKPVKSSLDPCPGGWRLPSAAEFEKLCSGGFSPLVEYNGKLGRWFTGSTPYSASVSARVFFPAAGYRSTDAKPAGRNEIGWYWSSESDTFNRGHYMAFGADENPHFVAAVGRSTAGAQSISMSVRCVKE